MCARTHTHHILYICIYIYIYIYRVNPHLRPVARQGDRSERVRKHVAGAGERQVVQLAAVRVGEPDAVRGHDTVVDERLVGSDDPRAQHGTRLPVKGTRFARRAARSPHDVGDGVVAQADRHAALSSDGVGGWQRGHVQHDGVRRGVDFPDAAAGGQRPCKQVIALAADNTLRLRVPRERARLGVERLRLRTRLRAKRSRAGDAEDDCAKVRHGVELLRSVSPERLPTDRRREKRAYCECTFIDVRNNDQTTLYIAICSLDQRWQKVFNLY